jgi:hypothetical protein
VRLKEAFLISRVARARADPLLARGYTNPV